MAITLFGRDRRWALPGQTLTLTCSFTVGTRFRTYLRSKPAESALDLWDPARKNYLTSNRITPDVPGVYDVVFVEETVTLNVPHFSNDTGGALSKGLERITVVDTQIYHMACAGRVTRQIGTAPDQCTVELYAANDDSAYTPGTTYANLLSGVITAYADRTLCARLLSGTSDAAKIAMTSPAVASAVRAIGGYGDPYSVYGDRYGETLSLVPWTSVTESSLYDALAWTIQRLNAHMTATQVFVHNGTDTVHTLTGYPAAVGNATGQTTLLNSTLSALAGHAADVTAVHWHADAAVVSALGALPALVSPTLPARIDRANALFLLLDQHVSTDQISLYTTDAVHNPGADSHLNALGYYPATTEAEMVALLNGAALDYSAHSLRANVCLYGYHNIGGTSDSTYNERPPADRDGYVVAVRKLLQVLHAHVTNTNFLDGTTTDYHLSPDWSSRTDFVGGPTDFPSAVTAHEVLDSLLAQHVEQGASITGITVHGYGITGSWWKWTRGLAGIHRAFRNAIVAPTSVPTNELPPYVKLVQLGGCQRG